MAQERSQDAVCHLIYALPDLSAILKASNGKCKWSILIILYEMQLQITDNRSRWNIRKHQLSISTNSCCYPLRLQVKIP